MGGSPWLWAQANAGGDPAATAYLALRRWCGGLTLSPALPAPDWIGLAAPAAAALLLVFLAMACQGPAAALRQFFDVPGHANLVREAVARVWRSGRLVTALLAFTVASWTASQCIAFVRDDPERGRADLVMLERGRGPIQLPAEHAAHAAGSPLRDVAGLGDNLPLLVAALVVLLSRASRGPAPAPAGLKGHGGSFAAPPAEPGMGAGAATMALGLYLLYRLFCRLAGSPDLPTGNCLVVEVAIIPGLMLISDGFLLAWVLAELRDGEPGDDQVDRVDPSRALRLMPAACLACLAALPARYAATSLLLATQHIPPTLMATGLGRGLRWSLGPGVATIQAASLIFLGMAGAAAWGGGTFGEATWAFRRLLRAEGGRLAAATILAAVGCAGASAAAYAALLALPPAGWVLPAADAYAHYATLPIGLWSLAACIQIAERTLPRARLAAAEGDADAPALDGEAEAAPVAG
ncbi:MAG: hypothetical protein BGO49_06105 [Planctomycetales bacterium 71-10]|nr:MAG: hypothetical protein BGO49_06105 [Planctomycetales bacterium 71-10]